MPQPPKGWFRWDFGLAGAVIYGIVVLIVNFDKSFIEISYLVLRQVLMTFVVTSALMGFVLKHALRHPTQAYFWGALVPATITALAAFVAHWYFTSEVRNILAPFMISISLNSAAVTLARLRHDSFGGQIKAVLQLNLRKKK